MPSSCAGLSSTGWSHCAAASNAEGAGSGWLVILSERGRVLLLLRSVVTREAVLIASERLAFAASISVSVAATVGAFQRKTAQTMVKAVGQGKIFVYEKGRKAFLLDLSEEFIYVEGSNLLALEETLTVQPRVRLDLSRRPLLATRRRRTRQQVVTQFIFEAKEQPNWLLLLFLLLKRVGFVGSIGTQDAPSRTQTSPTSYRMA